MEVPGPGIKSEPQIRPVAKLDPEPAALCQGPNPHFISDPNLWGDNAGFLNLLYHSRNANKYLIYP